MRSWGVLQAHQCVLFGCDRWFRKLLQVCVVCLCPLSLMGGRKRKQRLLLEQFRECFFCWECAVCLNQSWLMLSPWLKPRLVVRELLVGFVLVRIFRLLLVFGFEAFAGTFLFFFVNHRPFLMAGNKKGLLLPHTTTDQGDFD